MSALRRLSRLEWSERDERSPLADADAAHLLEEARLTRPLSVMMSDQVSALRAWARERTVSAD